MVGSLEATLQKSWVSLQFSIVIAGETLLGGTQEGLQGTIQEEILTLVPTELLS